MGNIELLKRTRNQIVMFPEKHDQSSWHCGTTMCIAGHASVLAGAELRSVGEHGATELVFNGRPVSASLFADVALGLSDLEHNYLFFCMNNEISIKRMDQLIELWEQGKTLEDIDWDDRITDPDHCDCSDCN